MENKNNYAFIDSQNLNLGVKSQGWNLDFARFRQFLKDKYEVEKAVIVSGDGDFVPLVQFLKSSVQCEVIAFGKNTSAKLKEATDDFIDMSADPKKFTIPISKKSKKTIKN